MSRIRWGWWFLAGFIVVAEVIALIRWHEDGIREAELRARLDVLRWAATPDELLRAQAESYERGFTDGYWRGRVEGNTLPLQLPRTRGEYP